MFEHRSAGNRRTKLDSNLVRSILKEIGTTTWVSDRIFDFYLGCARSVLEPDLDGIGIRAPGGIEKTFRITRHLFQLHPDRAIDQYEGQGEVVPKILCV